MSRAAGPIHTEHQVMTIFSSSAFRRTAFGVTLACALLSPARVDAQNSTGSLSGRVSNAATGHSLQGAVVRIVGTPFKDFTDSTGSFDFQSLPAGKYQISVEYV